MARTGETFESWFVRYIDQADFADSTRTLRQEIFRRYIGKDFGRRRLSEISEQEIRAVCERIKEKGAPSQAIHTR
uniref:hypothetical protein n=1 Tax=Neisseria chenwenguii TaxID=1853278 RepID=UPI0038CD8220